MAKTRRKLSKKHEKAKEVPKRHGAECGVCAKPRRLKKEILAKQLVKDLEDEFERYCECVPTPPTSKP